MPTGDPICPLCGKPWPCLCPVKIHKVEKQSIFPPGTKYDSDKIRWELLPFKEIGEIAEIFTFGAKKYTKVVDLDSNSMLSFLKEELEQCHAITATKIDLYWQKDSVDPAMKSSFVKRIRSLPNDNVRIGASGNETIQKSLPNTEKEDDQILQLDLKIKQLNESVSSENMVSVQRRINYYYKNRIINAQFAEEILAAAQFISITTIKQGSLEATYVVGATTDLECLETISKVLQKQYNIFQRVQQISISNNKIQIKYSGDGNWKHVRPLKERYFGALMRHLTAWYEGERLDPESGRSHLAHAGCCLLFLMWGDNNKDKTE